MARVLLVDDEPAIRDLVTEILIPEGHEILHAEDGSEAVEVVRAESPDLVILDVMMPLLDGFAACRLLKADPDTAPTPVLLLTALADDEARASGEEAGADAHMTKPFQPDALVTMVAHLLRARDAG